MPSKPCLALRSVRLPRFIAKDPNILNPKPLARANRKVGPPEFVPRDL